MALGKWLSRVLQAQVKNIEEELLFHIRSKTTIIKEKKERERLVEKERKRTWPYLMSVYI